MAQGRSSLLIHRYKEYFYPKRNINKEMQFGMILFMSVDETDFIPIFENYIALKFISNNKKLILWKRILNASYT